MFLTTSHHQPPLAKLPLSERTLNSGFLENTVLPGRTLASRHVTTSHPAHPLAIRHVYLDSGFLETPFYLAKHGSLVGSAPAWLTPCLEPPGAACAPV